MPFLLVPWPQNLLGFLLVPVGGLPFFIGARNPWVRLLGLLTIWAGLLIVSPLALFLIAVPPAMVVIDRRRRMLRSYRLLEVRRSRPSAELYEWVLGYHAAGFRYAGSLVIATNRGDVPLEIMRLPDLRGWMELTWGGFEIQHRFGRHSFSTIDGSATGRPPRHLIQRCAAEELDERLRTHRRVLARLAQRGLRPERLSDDQVLDLVTEQIHAGYRRMAATGWRDAVRYTYWEERAFQGRLGCRQLADDPRFDRKVEAWAGE